MAPRRRRGPVAAEAVAFTVRFDQDEAIAVDEFVLAVRRAAGRRVDKSELVRALLRLARDWEDLRRAVAGGLRDD